ncbi:MAG: DUF2203 domain-containing protein [Candidatus Nitrohelix vancouverensis]|uniref:DUF2203 domain-containing protein n=1 Tax=Candidatus Nitrohelix vancouverensis TaxID=2705534 RepID=A0A7T0C3B4_9BACT|nr:MAG: DUF2203 domain-containing protein [Candidatus Nitrohelix vancouverensis]
MSQKKYFTVTEANSFVDRLLTDIPRIQELLGSLSNDFEDVKHAQKKANLNGGSLQGGAYLEKAVLFQDMIKRLESDGCILKGVQNGLVDFLHEREGREVYLCWRYPERKIEYWHEIDGGFAGRQKIE